MPRHSAMILTVAMIWTGTAALAEPAAESATEAVYAPVPAGYDMPAGYDFTKGPPTEADWVAAETRLLGLLDASDFVALRAHAWQVFAGITAPTPGSYATWESWYTADAVFGGPDTAPLLTLSDRRDDIHAARQLGFGLANTPEPDAGESVAANVLFNEEVRQNIWQNDLQKPDTLGKINTAFDAANAPLSDRSIPPFPHQAIALKTIWSVVSAEGLTILPVWDGALDLPEVKVSPPYPSDVWTRCVAITPDAGTAPATASVTCNGHPLTVEVVRLDRFYHFRITEAELAAVKTAVRPGPLDGTPSEIKAGDFAILLGIHFTTREIPNWVWGTAWWHDSPDAAPFGADRPDNVTGVWRNYMMSDGYSREVPLAVDDGPHTVWNPYIEGKYPDGMRSNCMSCHVRAVYPRLDPVIDGSDMCGALPVLRGDASLPLDDPALGSRTRLSFLWSILLETDNGGCK